MRLNPTSDQKVEEKDPHFFKWGSVFLNFLILDTVLSHIIICCRATIECVNFSRFWPLKIKISDTLMVENLTVGQGILDYLLDQDDLGDEVIVELEEGERGGDDTIQH